jgi:hypothetical protein
LSGETEALIADRCFPDARAHGMTRSALLPWTSCDGPWATSTGCSIRDGAATSPAVATLFLADSLSHAIT